MNIVIVAGASFLASAVEMVEALTIVLAVGVTRGWRSSLIGVGVALVVLGRHRRGVGPGADSDTNRCPAIGCGRRPADLRTAVAS